MLVIKIKCNNCKEEFQVEVEEADYKRWASRQALIQDAMPYLSISDRELLLSQTCQTCFDEMFGEE